MRTFLLCVPLIFCLACSDTSHRENPSAESNQQTIKPEEATLTDSAKEYSASDPESAFQVVPGQRMGQILLGDSPQRVVQVLGEPDAQNAAMGKALLTWYGSGTAQNREKVTVFTVRENTGMPNETVRVHQVRGTSPRFQILPTGVHSGSTVKEIRQAFPEAQAVAYYTQPDKQRVYLYDATAQGITFEITGSDSVAVAITVHRKGISVTEAYLPLHPNVVPLGQR